MCFFVSLIPATVWIIIGFFVLFVSTKAEGGLRKFGQVLAIWTFIIASFFPIAGAYMTISGMCPMEQHFKEMMGKE